MYRWQDEDIIVGSLEVPSEPAFDFRGDLKPLQGVTNTPFGDEREIKESFQRARGAWDEMGLQRSFIAACKSMPASTLCCGLMTDDDKMLQDLVPHLNKVWSPYASEQMESAGFAVDCFLWSWENLQGKSTSFILLIRFHDLSKCSGKIKSESNKSLGSAKRRGSNRSTRSSNSNTLPKSMSKASRNGSMQSVKTEITVSSSPGSP